MPVQAELVKAIELDRTMLGTPILARFKSNGGMRHALD
jgi:hypothetical protein